MKSNSNDGKDTHYLRSTHCGKWCSQDLKKLHRRNKITENCHLNAWIGGIMSFKLCSLHVAESVILMRDTGSSESILRSLTARDVFVNCRYLFLYCRVCGWTFSANDYSCMEFNKYRQNSTT